MLCAVKDQQKWSMRLLMCFSYGGMGIYSCAERATLFLEKMDSSFWGGILISTNPNFAVFLVFSCFSWWSQIL